MDVILGIDIGGSTTKIVGLRTDGSVISMLRIRAEDQVTSLYGALGNYLTSNRLSLRDVRRVVLTGAIQAGHLILCPDPQHGDHTAVRPQTHDLGGGAADVNA